MASPGNRRAASTSVFSLAMIVIGAAILVRTLAAGGSGLSSGVVLGVLFMFAGGGRLYLGRVNR